MKKSHALAALTLALFGLSGVFAATPHKEPHCTPKKAAAKKCKAAISGTLRTSKTSLGAQINYVVDSPVLGAATQVRLSVKAGNAALPLTIELASDAGLRLEPGLPGNVVEQNSAAADYVVRVVPEKEGLLYVHVYLRSGGLSEALAIPVQVGANKTLSQPMQAKPTPSGERIISIPAQQ